jgi:MFS family permease
MLTRAVSDVDDPNEPQPSLEDSQDALFDGDLPVSGTALSALRHKTFRRVFTGAFLSNIGSWMQNVVLGALAYDLTHSAVYVGVLFAAQLGPLLLLSIVGGALADLVDRRKLLILVSIEQGLLSLLLALVVRGDDPSTAAIALIVLGIGIGQAIFGPVYSALLPSLVGRRDLAGAISLNSAQMNGSRVIGPVIGAALDHAFGASSVFSLNAATYLFVIGALLIVRLPPPLARTDDEPLGVARLAAGFKVARADPIVARCLITIATFSLLSLPFVGQMPVIAARNLGIDPRSSSYGVLYTCFGLGAMCGALSIGTVFSRRSKEMLVRPALVFFATFLGVFALLRSPGPAYVAIALLGLGYFALVTSLLTVLQQRLDDRSRGRVMALWIMGFGGTVPLGNLLAGPIIEATSVTTLLLGGVVVALGLAVYADLRGEPVRSSRPALAD